MNSLSLYENAINEYRIRTPKSEEAYQNARKVIAGGETRSVSFYSPYPLTIEKASGSRICDVDGNEYIDFINNYTSMIHGHAHPVIEKSIKDAIVNGTSHPAGILEQTELAQILCDRLPSVQRVRFCNSGTEATMFAVRAAMAFKGRNGILKMDGGYHGTTDMMEYNVFQPINPDEKRINLEPTPDSVGISLNVGRDLYIAPFNNLEEVERILKEHGKKIAAIIVEPMLGAGGVIPPQPGYLTGLRQLANQYDVLLIFDEVQTLRLSLGGAQEKYNVMPDLTAVAKIIGGGLPVGALGGREDIMSIFDRTKGGVLFQSGTFNGNRATMAAGIASMKLLDAEAINHLEELAICLEDGMNAAIKRLGLPFSTTRVGSLLNLHLTPESPVDYGTTYTPYEEMLKLYHLEMLKRRVFVAPRGLWVLSTVMTKKDIDIAINAFEEVMQIIKFLF